MLSGLPEMHRHGAEQSWAAAKTRSDARRSLGRQNRDHMRLMDRRGIADP
jgi:hypothetical protein